MEDVGKHVGDSIVVCGKVASARYLEQSKGSPTFLNLGNAFPNHLLTVVIWSDVRRTYESAPEKVLLGKTICIAGKVELYKDKPQIVIQAKGQIKTEE
ncbi:MAG: hypothetical protein ACXVLT_07675 [Flavisolibacter sp.]